MKKTKKQLELEAKNKHKAWLRKNNCHPDQISERQSTRKSKKLTHVVATHDPKIQLSNTIVSGGAKIGIMENLHKESPYVQMQIKMKAANAMPLFKVNFD